MKPRTLSPPDLPRHPAAGMAAIHPTPAARLLKGIELFNARQFFHCHEVWEEEWVSSQGPRRWFLQSLIHIAVALHHYQHNNHLGAERQLHKGLLKLAGYLPTCEGVCTLALYQDALPWWEAVRARQGCERFPRIQFCADNPPVEIPETLR